LDETTGNHGTEEVRLAKMEISTNAILWSEYIGVCQQRRTLPGSKRLVSMERAAS